MIITTLVRPLDAFTPLRGIKFGLTPNRQNFKVQQLFKERSIFRLRSLWESFPSSHGQVPIQFSRFELSSFFPVLPAGDSYYHNIVGSNDGVGLFGDTLANVASRTENHVVQSKNSPMDSENIVFRRSARPESLSRITESTVKWGQSSTYSITLS